MLAVVTVGVALLGAGSAGANAARPSFSTGPDPAGLAPDFGWGRHDYAVRCDAQEIDVHVDGAPGWQARIGDRAPRSGSFDVTRPLGYDRAFAVTFVHGASGRAQHFHVRCLPADFPSFHFKRIRRGGPRFFGIQMNPYATMFDSDGAPIWWYDTHNDPNNVEMLPDGTVAWDPVDPVANVASVYRVRKLNGRLVRKLTTPGATTDLHELLLLPNGNYLMGGRVTEHHVDASQFGGSSDADAIGIEIQEVTPSEHVVWKWDSADHIALDETPQRWWDNFLLPAGSPYDIVHWNAAEPDGKYVLLSFRHLDAIYAINRRTGNVAWKLGGTTTAKSLTVIGDPEGSYPLGGQHDVRVLPDGTISIHDNNTQLPDPPRVVRYRVNVKQKTARLVQSLSDPRIPGSICCGSARMSPSGDWLVGWGGNPVTTAYDSRGRRIYSLKIGEGFSYRSNPVPPGLVSARDFRHGMNSMSR
jgi:hypothetical protein